MNRTETLTKTSVFIVLLFIILLFTIPSTASQDYIDHTLLLKAKRDRQI